MRIGNKAPATASSIGRISSAAVGSTSASALRNGSIHCAELPATRTSSCPLKSGSKKCGGVTFTQGTHFRICSDPNNLQQVLVFPAHQQVRAYWVGVEQELPRKCPVHNYRDRFPSTITDFEVPATQDGNTLASCSTSPPLRLRRLGARRTGAHPGGVV